jgi:oligosaccharide repeat unit polymerase
MINQEMQAAAWSEGILLDGDSFTNGEEKRTSILLLAVLFMSLVVSLLLSRFAPGDLSRPFLGVCVTLAAAAILLQCISKFTLPKPVNWFSVDILFAAAFFLVHFWYTFAWLAGLLPSAIEFWRDTSVVCYASAMSLAGLLAFLLGYNLLPERFSRMRQGAWIDGRPLINWRRFGITVFIVGIISVVVYVMALGAELFQGAYTGSQKGGYWAQVLYLLLGVLLNLGFVVMTIASGQLWGKWKVGIITKLAIMFFLAYLFVLGDRSLAFSFVIVLGVAYAEYIKPMSLKRFALAIIAGLFIISVGLIGRKSPQRTITSFVSHAVQEKEDVSLEGGALNVGGSVRCINEAVRIVPSRYNYFLGKGQVAEIIGLIPFSRRLFDVTGIEYLGSASVLTWSMYGSFESGAGTTIIADIYMDFGYPGVVLIMFLLGLLCKYVQQRARSSASMVSGVAYCCLVSTCALLPRYSLGSLIRGVLWPVLALLLVGSILGIPSQPSQEQLSTYALERDLEEGRDET